MTKVTLCQNHIYSYVELALIAPKRIICLLYKLIHIPLMIAT